MILSLKLENEILLHKINKSQIEDQINGLTIKKKEEKINDQIEAEKLENYELIRVNNELSKLIDLYKNRAEKLQSLLDSSLTTQMELKKSLIFKTYPKQVNSSDSSKDSDAMTKPKSKTLSEAKGKLVDSKSEEMMTQIFELLEQNQITELDNQRMRVEVEDAKERYIKLEAELQGFKRAYEEIKLTLGKKDTESSENSTKSLMIKLKAKDIELNILQNERENIHKVKDELLEAKRQVITYNIIPSLNDDSRNYSLAPHKEHIYELFLLMRETSERARKANDIALKCVYFLKSTLLKNQRLENTVIKYQNDLKEKRKEEMEVLERIIQASMKKYLNQENQTENVAKAKPQVKIDEKALKNEHKQSKASKTEEPQKSISKIVEEEQQKFKEMSKPITIETHAAALQK